MTSATASLIVAGIAAVVAAGTAFYTARNQRKLHEKEERSRAKVVLDTYRGPLLSAAWELGDRIDNLRNRNLAGFGPSYQDAIRLTTAFRLAQYFGWREVLRVEVQLLRFESESDTSHAAKLMSDIVWVFATDKVVDEGGLMLWAEDQRSIGELMLLDPRDARARARGYASFVNDYDLGARRRVEAYTEQVVLSATTSERLRLLQWLLLGLVLQLDEEHVYSYDHGWMLTTLHELHGTTAPKPETNAVEVGVRRDLGDLPHPLAERTEAAHASG